MHNGTTRSPRRRNSQFAHANRRSKCHGQDSAVHACIGDVDAEYGGSDCKRGLAGEGKGGDCRETGWAEEGEGEDGEFFFFLFLVSLNERIEMTGFCSPNVQEGREKEGNQNLFFLYFANETWKNMAGHSKGAGSY